MHNEPRSMAIKDYSFGEHAALAEVLQNSPDYALYERRPLVIWLARILPLAGALMLVVATWLPWATLRIVIDPEGLLITDSSTSGLAGFQMLLGQSGFASAHPSVMWLELAWTILPLFGLLIGLSHLRVRQWSRALTALFSVWLLLATLSVASVVYGLMTTLAPLSCWQTCSPVSVISRQPESGAWLAIGGLALGWIALAGLLNARRSNQAMARPATLARYSALHGAGAGVLTLGVALWALGLYAVPWVTSGCTGLQFSLNHFVRGTCSGMDGYDMLSATMSGDGQLAWEFFELASVMGLFLAITVWLPRLTRSTWIIAAGWSVLVALMVFMGLHGIEVTMAHPPHFTADEGPWEPSFGIVICASGIVVDGVGIALLAREEIGRAG